MKHHETVVIIIIVPDHQGELLPQRRLYVGRVNQRVEGYGFDPAGEFGDFGHLTDNLAEVKRAESPDFGVSLHTYGSPGVNQEYGRLIHR